MQSYGYDVQDVVVVVVREQQAAEIQQIIIFVPLVRNAFFVLGRHTPETVDSLC
jgi:hypothetical protein